MSKLYKRQKDTDDIGIESKEGERRRLYSNNVGNRFPSLELTTCENSKEQENENFILTPQTIDAFTAFALTLKKIHVRLVMEGYVIKDGQIYKPEEIDHNETSNKNNNTNT